MVDLSSDWWNKQHAYSGLKTNCLFSTVLPTKQMCHGFVFDKGLSSMLFFLFLLFFLFASSVSSRDSVVFF